MDPRAASSAHLTPAEAIRLPVDDRLAVQAPSWGRSPALQRSSTLDARRSLARTLAERRLLVGGIILLGLVLRLVHLAFIDLSVPFRLGGLYLEFAEQILAHRYALPHTIPFYTDGGIPFAYPPLPFYVAAVLLDLGLPKFLVVNLLPPLVAALAVPSFYLLTRELRLSFPTQLAALLAFVTLPVGYAEQLEAGGLAEAFGGLALIWLVIGLVRAHEQGSLRRYVWVGVLGALCVLASPASAYAAAPTLVLFGLVELWRGDWRARLRTLGLLGLSALLTVGLSSPYWLTVVNYHGAAVFLESVGRQHRDWTIPVHVWLTYFTIFQFKGDPNPFVWNVLTFIGAIWTLVRGPLVLLVWFVILANIPREGYWLMALPASLLSGIGAVEVLGPLVGKVTGHAPKSPQHVMRVALLSLVLGLSIVAMNLAWLDEIRGQKGKLGKQPALQDFEAMEWVATSTPADGKLVVVSRDQVKEWVPQIARRTVLNMSFGSEWVPKKRDRIEALEGRIHDCPDFYCMQQAVRRTMGYDQVYLFVDRERLANSRTSSGLQHSAQAIFRPLWENQEITLGLLRGLVPADEKADGPAGSYIRLARQDARERDQATRTLNWSTGDAAEGRVYLSANGGPELPFADGSSGSLATPRIGKGDVQTFRLYTGSDSTVLLATTTFRGD
jgi:hypothetical protein